MIVRDQAGAGPDRGIGADDRFGEAAAKGIEASQLGS